MIPWSHQPAVRLRSPPGAHCSIGSDEVFCMRFFPTVAPASPLGKSGNARWGNLESDVTGVTTRHSPALAGSGVSQEAQKFDPLCFVRNVAFLGEGSFWYI